MKKTKITKDKILSLIEEEAHIIQRKKELYEEVKKINGELKQLNERGMVGTLGFKVPGDAMEKSAHATGFVNPQNISHIAQLEKEMGALDVSDKPLDETSTLKQENEQLKKQIEEMTARLQESSVK